MDKNAPKRVVKPEYVPISEEQAKALLKSGRGRRPAQAASWKFTLMMLVAVLVLIISGTMTYYTWFEDPRVVPRLEVKAIQTDSTILDLAPLVSVYNRAPDSMAVKAMCRALLERGTLPVAFGLDVLEQAIAWGVLDISRRLAGNLEREIGDNADLRRRLLWLKAHLAYEAVLFEESRFYLRMLVASEGAYYDDAKAMLAEVDALLDRSLF
jgi:hypothetical protein